VAAAVETTTLLEVERPGMIYHRFLINSGTHLNWSIATLAVVLDTFLATVYKVPSVTTVLDSCELHFSITQLLLTTDSRSRVTLARTAPSHRGALATPVVLKGSCTPFLPFTEC